MMIAEFWKLEAVYWKLGVALSGTWVLLQNFVTAAVVFDACELGFYYPEATLLFFLMLRRFSGIIFWEGATIFERTMMNADYSAAPRTVFWATRGHAHLRPKRFLTLRESEHFLSPWHLGHFNFSAFVISV
ncbi:hypothetical protein MA16_Dca006613 [Dendrobium catenatum]|uniref:Uncharacterized protein n=1 Tax=Dendrobium catenatum TaxID=906689 RepID=A0A2I0X5P0_9ASPA|nr:hypothetical protein MA16_Dca006613 [Dendrobium catenatum]